jgi:hypothetical protein
MCVKATSTTTDKQHEIRDLVKEQPLYMSANIGKEDPPPNTINGPLTLTSASSAADVDPVIYTCDHTATAPFEYRELLEKKYIIVETYNVETIKLLRRLYEWIKTLFVIDNDDTITLRDEFLFFKQNYQKVFKFIANNSSNANASLAAILNNIPGYRPSDPDFQQLLDSMNKDGIRYVVLTKCNTGALGPIQSMSENREIILNACGYNPGANWLDTENMRLQVVGDENVERSVQTSLTNPEFRGGILLTGTLSKGEVLQAFLDIVKDKYNPEVIIFIDDSKEQLLALGKYFLNHPKYKMVLAWYRGADVFYKNQPPVNPTAATIQLRHVCESQEWIRYGEALKLVENKKKHGEEGNEHKSQTISLPQTLNAGIKITPTTTPGCTVPPVVSSDSSRVNQHPLSRANSSDNLTGMQGSPHNIGSPVQPSPYTPFVLSLAGQGTGHL